MSFVVDASIAGAWVLPDEAAPGADQLMDRLNTDTALVPTLFWHEIRGLVVMAERRGRLSAGAAAGQVAIVRRFPIRYCGAGDDQAIIGLALARNLTAYDATYLALAIAERLPLATLDRKLAQAAQAEGVPILGPLGSG